MTASSLCLVLLLVVFVTLKLCHVIAWSWLWVLAPLWVPVMFAAIVGVLMLIGLFIDLVAAS